MVNKSSHNKLSLYPEFAAAACALEVITDRSLVLPISVVRRRGRLSSVNSTLLIF